MEVRNWVVSHDKLSIVRIDQIVSFKIRKIWGEFHLFVDTITGEQFEKFKGTENECRDIIRALIGDVI